MKHIYASTTLVLASHEPNNPIKRAAMPPSASDCKMAKPSLTPSSVDDSKDQQACLSSISKLVSAQTSHSNENSSDIEHGQPRNPLKLATLMVIHLTKIFPRIKNGKFSKTSLSLLSHLGGNAKILFFVMQKILTALLPKNASQRQRIIVERIFWGFFDTRNTNTKGADILKGQKRSRTRLAQFLERFLSHPPTFKTDLNRPCDGFWFQSMVQFHVDKLWTREANNSVIFPEGK